MVTWGYDEAIAWEYGYNMTYNMTYNMVVVRFNHQAVFLHTQTCHSLYMDVGQNGRPRGPQM